MKMIIENELRPCMVSGQKALFHCWEQRKSEDVSCTLGIIEREDGTIHRAYPEEICFTDRKLAEYVFCEKEREKNG